MQESLNTYIRKRAKELGLPMTTVCQRAGISRQTLYSIAEGTNLPTIPTVISLADALHVHPMRILQIIFDRAKSPQAVTARKRTGDQSAFVGDVSYPDGSIVPPGHTFTKTWELKNVGKQVWENRFMQCQDEETVVYNRSGEVLTIAESLVPAATRFPVPLTQPGQTCRFSMEFTAPRVPCTVVSYWKSVFADGSLCFPRSPGVWVKVRVTTVASGATNEEY